MHTFKDADGRDWALNIHVASVKACRSVLGVDLLSLVEDEFAGLAKLLSDPIALIDVVYVLCRDEASARGLDDVGFGAAMRGDAIERASDAFTRELCDFFPNPRVRAGLAKLVEKSAQVRDVMIRKLMDRASRELDAIDPESLGDVPSAPATGSPESSALPPAP